MTKPLSYAERQKRREIAAKRKASEMAALIATLDRVIADALKDNSAYHTGEIRDLNVARSSLMRIRGGYSNRVRR